MHAAHAQNPDSEHTAGTHTVRCSAPRRSRTIQRDPNTCPRSSTDILITPTPPVTPTNLPPTPVALCDKECPFDAQATRVTKPIRDLPPRNRHKPRGDAGTSLSGYMCDVRGGWARTTHIPTSHTPTRQSQSRKHAEQEGLTHRQRATNAPTVSRGGKGKKVDSTISPTRSTTQRDVRQQRWNPMHPTAHSHPPS